MVSQDAEVQSPVVVSSGKPKATPWADVFDRGSGDEVDGEVSAIGTSDAVAVATPAEPLQAVDVDAGTSIEAKSRLEAFGQLDTEVGDELELGTEVGELEIDTEVGDELVLDTDVGDDRAHIIAAARQARVRFAGGCEPAANYNCVDDDDKMLASSLWILDEGHGPGQDRWPEFLSLLAKHTEFLVQKCPQGCGLVACRKGSRKEQANKQNNKKKGKSLA